jgi:Glycosyl transferase 4-like domain
MSRSVIIVSPYFPPSTLAGVHRARHLAKHLPAAGWTPTVVCVDEAYHEEALDPALAALVPDTVEIVKTPAVPSFLTRPLAFGDISVRGWHHIKRAVERLADERSIDAALITGAPYYPMLLAKLLRRRGIPVILDFQDPWVSRWGQQQPALSKAGLSHRLAAWLEPRALHEASYVTSVSQKQNAELAQRYDWLDISRMAAIPIGGDPDDFEACRTGRAGIGDGILAPNRINLSFVGSYASRFEPVIRTLFEAARQLRAVHPEIARRIRLNFIGTSALPNGHSAYRIRPFAEQAGIGEMVHEVPQRLPYVEALAAMARSDGLLLIGSDEPHYTASRIYPALISGRPYLSLYHRASSAHTILSGAGGGITVSFADAEALTQLSPQLSDGLRRLAVDPASLGRAAPSAYAAYEARAIAQQFATVFEAVSIDPMPAKSMAGRRISSLFGAELR